MLMQTKTDQKKIELKKNIFRVKGVSCLTPLILFFVIFAFGCNTGNSSATSNSSSIDTTAPSISIEYPTSGSGFITIESSLGIFGSASDNKGISRVTWSTNAGYTGIADGRTQWEALVPLSMGLNEVTFTATDAAGNTATDSLSVTYTTVSHSVSGAIAAADNVVVDSDVNDVNEVYVSNDSLSEAQEIPNPVIIGGFVNVSGAGAVDGRSYVTGDSDDFFRVSLYSGDEITLVIGEYLTADMDLYIFDESGLLVDSSLGTGGTETLTVSDSGTYTINVKADRGASNYTLSVGSASDGSSQGIPAEPDISTLRLSDDFVPGEVIVKFKDTPGIQARAQDVQERIRSKGLFTASKGHSRLALAKMNAENKETVFRNMGISSPSISIQPKDIRSQRKMDTLRMIKGLRKQSDVLYAEPNYYVHISEIPNDNFYATQWNLPMINLPNAWDITTGSSDIVVAVVDTGVLMNHPDLQGQLTTDGYDFISDNDISLDGDGIDDNPDDPGDLRYNTYSSFHGTHCAGIVAAASNNDRGVSGVAWNTKIMPVRVLGNGGSGTTYDVLQGVLYAAGLENDSGTLPTHPADIISLSLGSNTYLSQAQQVYNEVRDQGVIVVAAAGNSSTSAYDYPASYNGVISVSAVDITGDLAFYSNYGARIDVAAPGGDGSTDINGDGYPDGVMSTCGDDRYGSIVFSYSPKNGTSMATPHVAGVAALMKAIDPELTPAQFDAHLQNFDIVTDAGIAGWDEEFGYGIIDAYKAVQVAQSGVTGATLRISPEAFNFGYSTSNMTLVAEKTGDDALSFHVDSVEDDADWLTVVPDSVDAQGLGTYIAQADRTGLADGFYTTMITFITTIGSQTTYTLVRANIQVNASGTLIPDSGYHYVLLVTADTLDPVRMEEVVAQDGFYDFTFDDVPDQGHYKIFAGTDRDHDWTINNYGESFGAYGSIDQPLEIMVTDNLTGLDFNTELNVSFTADLQTMAITPSVDVNPSVSHAIK